MSNASPTDFRMTMIKMGLEAEMKGFRLTGKAPPCFTIIAREFGIKAKRGPLGKRAAYEEFCKRFGFDAKPIDAPTPTTDNGTAD